MISGATYSSLKTQAIASGAVPKTVPNEAKEGELFGPEIRDTVNIAFEKTKARLERSLGRGKLREKDAARGFEMLRELSEGLDYFRRGDVVMNSVRKSDDNGGRWILETPTGDQFEVRARNRQDQRGQARLGIRQVADDGRRVDKRDQLDLRIDRDRKGACVDLQFLHKSFNEKVHGRIGIGSKAYANHHFRDGIAGELNNVDNFSDFVQDFRDDNIAILLK